MKKLMMKLKCLAALAAGTTAFGALGGTFLDSLATNAYKVDSSPYATGGDIILHLNGDGYDDYVHVFSSTAAAATFSPTTDLHARLLMVAGGGSGGGCNGSAISGGGGAGGLIYRNDIVLANGTTYTVTVGAGGAGVSGQAGGNSGKDTTFIANDSSISLTAVKGGGGGGWYNAPKTGGSGGGGSGGQNGTVYAPAAGTQDQGHAGGAATANACGGGGGGAGEPGHKAVESPNALRRAGDGGDGLAFDITGAMEYYAGGGGAGGSSYPNRAKGGLGGGGDGATSKLTPAVSGEDGKGGGGGGIIVNGVKSGKGGDGIVIVRYCVYSGEAPLLRPCVLEVTGGSVVEGLGAFAALGDGATSASATITFTPKGGSTAPVKTYTLAEVANGPLTADSPFTFKLTGLAYDTEYDYEISADNGSASAVAQTGTLKTFSKSLAATATGTCDTISIGDLDKAFVFTGDGTFTVGGSGYAQVLVVGGGGGGGTISGGGGGGGGVYYNRALLLAPGTYAVTVGAGGSGGTSGPYSDSMSGGSPSSFVGGDGTGISISVLGGGRGARWDGGNRATDGGCGGGASGNNGNGYGTVGQGYDGGASANSRGSGGGGATANGKSGTSTSGGAGGAGFSIDITGEMLDYGSGGGGGCSTQKGNKGPGGAAGGDGAGHGANSTVSTDDDKPSNGLDGRGGGGGGGNGTKYNGTFGGNGGSGTVIVRYTDYSLAGSKPIINITEISNIGCHSADVNINVPYAGDDADVTMTYSWGYTLEDLTLGSVTVNNFMGEEKYTIDGLSPNRPYYVVATARNSAGTVASTNSFTTVQMFSKALSLATTGGKLTYTIDGAADDSGTDTEKLELYVGANADSLELRATYDTAELLTAGAHTVTPFTTEEYGVSRTMFFRHIATDGEHAFTNETAVLTSTLQDAVTYKWNADVADGDWTNPANWISTGGMRGWPTVGSTADFTSTACATVHVDRAINLEQVTYSKAGARYVFIGDTDDASVTPTARGVNGPAENQYLELDNLFFWFKHNNEFCVRSGTEIVLRNGAEMRLTKEDALTWNLYLYMDGGKLTVCDTSTFTCQDIQAGKGGELILENATHSFPKAELGARGAMPLKTVFRGAAPEFTVTGDLTVGDAGANWSLEVPREGYAAAPIRSVDFPKSGNGICNLTIEKKTSGLSKRSGKCAVPLVSASGSIDVSKVVFGATASPKGYFYFTDANGSSTNALGKTYLTAEDVGEATIKGIWYHHLSTGFAVIVR